MTSANGFRLVVVESPFAGDVAQNIRYARAALHDCLRRGESPYASHLLFTQPDVLDDDKPTDRDLGIEAGLAWGSATRAAVVVYNDFGVTPGMLRGINRAMGEGRTVEYRSIPEWHTVARSSLPPPPTLPRALHSMPHVGPGEVERIEQEAVDAATRPDTQLGGFPWSKGKP